MRVPSMPVRCALVLAVAASLAAGADAAPRDHDRLPLPRPGDEAPVRPGDAGPGLEAELADYLGAGREDEIVLPGSPVSLRGLTLRATGYWRLGFFASLSAVRDDNVFLKDRDTKSDHEFTTHVGGRAVREGASFATDVTAAVGFRTSTRDHGDEFSEGALRLGMAWQRSRGYVRAAVHASTREDERIDATGAGPGGGVVIDRGAAVRQNRGQVEILAGRRPEPGGWEARYRFDRVDYGRARESLDATEHTLEGDLRYAVSPVFQVRGGAGLHRVAYSRSTFADQEGGTVFAGATWEPGVHTTLDARLGYVARRPDGASAAGDDRSYRGPAAAVRGSWRATPKTLWEAGYVRDLHPSASGNYQRVDRVSAAWNWDLDLRWRAGATASTQWSSPSMGNRQRYRTAGIHVGLLLGEGMDLRAFVERQERSTRDAGGDYAVHRVGVQIAVLF